MYAGICLLGWIFCAFCYPETAGLSLEEVNSIFKNDYGIRAAAKLRKEKSLAGVGTGAAGISDESFW